ncbi:MAG: ATP phosphoribosyltransferase [Anaerolineaceae bacterium]|nr:ATP phosphoribosyltransferase [Anaerolineaceae bacterium]
MPERITLALPSRGVLAEPTLDFLRDCGLAVHKPNPRQYTGSVRTLPGVDVLFQRVKDVVAKVEAGTVELGIAGYDLVRELESDDLLTINDQLGYGHCQLQLAVPTTWVDVQGMADLVDVAQDFRQYHHRNLRIATNFNHLARQFLHAHGLHHYSLVRAEGAIEAAPTLGYADCVIDLSQTGTTLRENHLRPLRGGTLLKSQASLIGNRGRLQALGQGPRKLLRTLLELTDAALQGRERYLLSANLAGEDPGRLARKIMDNPVTRGLEGPTLAPTWNDAGQRGYAVTLVISADQLLPAVEYLRSIGGRQASARPLRHVFLEESPSWLRLQRLLDDSPQS